MVKLAALGGNAKGKLQATNVAVGAVMDLFAGSRANVAAAEAASRPPPRLAALLARRRMSGVGEKRSADEASPMDVDEQPLPRTRSRKL